MLLSSRMKEHEFIGSGEIPFPTNPVVSKGAVGATTDCSALLYYKGAR